MSESAINVSFASSTGVQLKATMAVVDPASLASLASTKAATEAAKQASEAAAQAALDSQNIATTAANTSTAHADQAMQHAQSAAEAAVTAEVAKAAALASEQKARNSELAASEASSAVLAVHGSAAELAASLEAANTAASGATTAASEATSAATKAEQWATSSELVDGVHYGAEKYAKDSATAQAAAEDSATQASNSASVALSHSQSAASAKQDAILAASSAENAKGAAETAKADTLQAKASVESLIATKSQEFDTEVQAAIQAKNSAQLSATAAESAASSASSIKSAVEGLERSAMREATDARSAATTASQKADESAAAATQAALSRDEVVTKAAEIAQDKATANEYLHKFVTDEAAVKVPTPFGDIPTLSQWARDREIAITKGRIPSNYVSGPLRLEVANGLTEQEFIPVDSYVPRAGDEVFAIGGTIVGVLASEEPLMERFCKYYGYPISINSYWNREDAAQFYAKFHGVVWGDNMGEPTHEANADTVAIAARVKELNPTIKIFGYVPIGLDPAWPDSNYPLEALYTKIDNWKATGATHIFLDEYGYDYFVTRDRQNALVQYCHDRGMFVCANSWSADYCFSNENIILPWADNFEGNPNLLPSLLTDQDYIQFENVLYKYHHEPGQESELKPEQWVNNNQRIVDMYDYMYEPKAEFGGQSYYDVYGTRGYALDAIIEYDQKMFDESYLAALALGMHAHAASIAFWGAVANTYHTYELPQIRAASRVALGKAVPSDFAGVYRGRVTTQIGPDEVEITWVQKEPEIAFTEASVVEGLEPKKHILAVEIPPEVTAVGPGWFTLTLGDSTDDARALSFAIEGTETQQQLLDKIANYAYHPDFLLIYEVIREQDRVLFQTLEPYTEELETWWVWHTESALSQVIDSFTLVQEGTDGKSLEYREIRINGEAVDQGFGPYWRKPRQVRSGYVYFDTTHNRNIIFRSGKWYDMQGNLADDFIDTGGAPSGAIVMLSDQTTSLPNGWVWCDGTNGTPNIPANPYPYIMKK